MTERKRKRLQEFGNYLCRVVSHNLSPLEPEITLDWGDEGVSLCIWFFRRWEFSVEDLVGRGVIHSFPLTNLYIDRVPREKEPIALGLVFDALREFLRGFGFSMLYFPAENGFRWEVRGKDYKKLLEINTFIEGSVVFAANGGKRLPLKDFLPHLLQAVEITLV